MFALFVFAALAIGCQVATCEKIDQDGCGQRPMAIPEYPFVCSLQDIYGDYYCRGSLITNREGKFFIITAAHCIYPPDLPDQKAVCSIHNNIYLDSQPHKQEFTFTKGDVHEQFNKKTMANDVAILHLKEQPVRNNYLQPICITTSRPENGEKATGKRWGKISEGGHSSYGMMEVAKPILSLERCQNDYYADVDNTTICAGFEDEDYENCQEDSGDPLVVSENGTYSLVGVASWPLGCGRHGYPDLYANVDTLRSWISSKINV